MSLSPIFEFDPKWEKEIVWVKPEAKQYSYVRETTDTAARRVKAPPHWIDKYVAYATLLPNAPSISPGVFERRVWYVMPRDLTGGSPVQAVNPDSIIAGQHSRRGKRGEEV